MSEQFKYVTEEELQGLSPNGRILAAISAAEEQEDFDEVSRLRKIITYPAEVLMTMKKTMGAEWIRLQELKTDLADQKYGQNWLNQ